MKIWSVELLWALYKSEAPPHSYCFIFSPLLFLTSELTKIAIFDSIYVVFHYFEKK